MPIKPRTHAQRMKALLPTPPDDRPSSSARGYGAQWRNLRRLKLNRNPMCEQPGCTEVATDVDHIIARSKGGEDMMENLQSLCHSHHSRKTALEDGGFRKPT